MRKGNFVRDFKKGTKQLNDIVIPYLKNKGFTITKPTLSEDKQGIDLYVSRENLQYSLQVKCDTKINSTSNFYLQDSKIVNNIADVMLYVDTVSKVGYAIRISTLIDNWDKIVQNSKYHEMDNVTYKTIGRIISIDDLSDIVVINRINLRGKE